MVYMGYVRCEKRHYRTIAYLTQTGYNTIFGDQVCPEYPEQLEMGNKFIAISGKNIRTYGHLHISL